MAQSEYGISPKSIWFVDNQYETNELSPCRGI